MTKAKGKGKAKPAGGPRRRKSAPAAPAGAIPDPRTSTDAGPVPAPPGADEVTPATPIVGREDLAPPAPLPEPRTTAPAMATPDPRTGTSERRLFRRVPFFRKVQYRFETMEEFKSRFANDLSLGGMFIKTETPEPMGTVIYLEFDLEDGSRILAGYGKVVRVNPPGLADYDPGMGIEFLKFDDDSLRRIRQLVAGRYEGSSRE